MHPIQDVIIDSHGTYRFRENSVVDHMIKELATRGYDLNNLHRDCHDHSIDDWTQFFGLQGYSVSGAPSMMDEDVREVAQRRCEALAAGEVLDRTQQEAEHYKGQLTHLKMTLAPIVSELYNIHEDDLLTST